MRIDHNIIDAIMVWARTKAPPESWTGPDMLARRRVRLEIAAEDFPIEAKFEHDDEPRETMEHGLLCRVYLAEPRSCDSTHTGGVAHMGCDHQPIAETRIA
jgi:hypothetical protein